MSTKVFIDGQAGTTALQIVDRLNKQSDIELIKLPDSERKNKASRAEAINQSDITFLCLPDEAAIESVSLLSNGRTRIIDTSTAHRTNPDWVFGLPELSLEQSDLIKNARFVSNPGCYSSASILLLAPLVKAGIIPTDYPVSIFGISGYTGGGKQMIADFEETPSFPSNLYGLNLHHKHIPEITKYSQLDNEPVFLPSVGNFPQGMLVSIPLHNHLLAHAGTISKVMEAAYSDFSHVKIIKTDQNPIANIQANEMAGTDKIKIYVFSDAKNNRSLLIASLDNLGKGAAGMAIQNFDLMTNA